MKILKISNKQHITREGVVKNNPTRKVVLSKFSHWTKEADSGEDALFRCEIRKKDNFYFFWYQVLGAEAEDEEIRCSSYMEALNQFKVFIENTISYEYE